MAPLVAWRRMKGRVNTPGVLTVKDRIDVEGPEWMRAVYKRLRARAMVWPAYPVNVKYETNQMPVKVLFR